MRGGGSSVGEHEPVVCAKDRLDAESIVDRIAGPATGGCLRGDIQIGVLHADRLETSVRGLCGSWGALDEPTMRVAKRDLSSWQDLHGVPVLVHIAMVVVA